MVTAHPPRLRPPVGRRRLMRWVKALHVDRSRLTIVALVLGYITLVQLFFGALQVQMDISAETAEVQRRGQPEEEAVHALPRALVSRRSAEHQYDSSQLLYRMGQLHHEAVQSMPLRQHFDPRPFDVATMLALMGEEEKAGKVLRNALRDGAERLLGHVHPTTTLHVVIGSMLGLLATNAGLADAFETLIRRLAHPLVSGEGNMVECAAMLSVPNLRRGQCPPMSLASLGMVLLEMTQLGRFMEMPIPQPMLEAVTDFMLRQSHSVMRRDWSGLLTGAPLPPHRGLHHVYIAANSSAYGPMTFSEGHGRFYDSILKSWILDSKQDPRLARLYDDAVEGLLRHLVRTTPGTLYTFSGYWTGVFEPLLDYTSCFIPGMLALGVSSGVHEYDGRSESHFTPDEILMAAKDLAATCFRLFDESPHGLAPERVRLRAEDGEPVVLSSLAAITPDMAESLLYLHRHTRDSRYLDWGSSIADTLYETLGSPSGFKMVRGVWGPPEVPLQAVGPVPSTFAATLSFLHLLFHPEAYPLEEFVFTARATPLRVKRRERGG